MGNKDYKESGLEKVAGGLPINIASTLLAAFSGNPMAALLPLLTISLAGRRHKARIESKIKEIEEILNDQKEKVTNLNDSQYKIVNESILAIFQTIEERKLEYLKQGIKNTIQDPGIKPHQAEFISRVIRDMSADEAAFLIKNESYELFQIGGEVKSKKRVLLIEPGSRDSEIVDGLTSLGLMVIGGRTWEEIFCYRFTPLLTKVLELLK